MKELSYTIQDEDGIHARPAGMLVKKMQEFESTVTISNGEKKADGKKLFQVMKLGAKQNDLITVETDGPDEDAALEAARSILEANL
ncbi:MAG: HPr family phosphocarrier protein [Planctomycetes bacterium]|nr:HPr family phosphocarrier protein [Planctomycetota bacterium]MCD7895633.1 HPr family phosphocarrier protein [Planctomycetaceae bacterium]